MMHEDNWSEAPINTNKHRNNQYPYLFTTHKEGIVVYFRADTMEPLCWIPDQYAAWAAIYYAAFTVHRLSANGVKKAEVRKEAERLSRVFRTKHLRDRVYIKTIKRQIGTAINLEASDQNRWATEYVTFEQDGQLIMARLLKRPGKGF